VDGDGIQVIRWDNGQPVGEIARTDVSQPSLDWPQLAYVQVSSGYRRLIVRNLVSGTTRYPHKVATSVDLGRPSLRGGRVAWHVVTRKRSRIFVRTLSQSERRVVAKTKIGRLSNPSLRGKRLIWVDARSGATYLRYGRLDSSKRKILARIRGRSATYWTTSLTAGTAYMTRWTISSGAAAVYRVPR
jgi:hypothetical protein